MGGKTHHCFACSKKDIKQSVQKEYGEPCGNKHVTLMKNMKVKTETKSVDCPEWKGPGVVIGQDGAVIFVRHGGTCVRVHRLRLRKVNTEINGSMCNG